MLLIAETIESACLKMYDALQSVVLSLQNQDLLFSISRAHNEVLQLINEGITAGQLLFGPPTRMYAMVSKQGTSCAETALCSKHYTREHIVEAERAADKDVIPHSWRDCTGNKELECIVCGGK